MKRSTWAYKFWHGAVRLPPFNLEDGKLLIYMLESCGLKVYPVVNIAAIKAGETWKGIVLASLDGLKGSNPLLKAFFHGTMETPDLALAAQYQEFCERALARRRGKKVLGQA